MDISELIAGVRGSFLIDDFLPAARIKNRKNKIEKELGINIPLINYEELVELSEELEVDVDKLFILKNGHFDLYVYLDIELGLFVSLYDGSIDTLKRFQIKDIIIQQSEALNKYIRERNYISYFNMIESRLRLIMLNKEFFNIPDKDKYDVFTQVYSSMDYGFDRIDEEIYKKVKELMPESVREKLIDKLEGDMLTIYRGLADKSTGIEGNSWTTSVSIAAFFATRFKSKNPKVYKAKIYIDDIVAYIDRRGESEVVVIESVMDIKQMDLITMDTVLKELPEVIYAFGQLSPIVDDISFATKLHGLEHSKRVLFLSFLISEIEDLTESEEDILNQVAIYHDIGRTCDGVCLIHGTDSFNKLRSSRLLEGYELEDRESIRYIMENHSIPDNQFISIDEYKIENKSRARKLLDIFKDIDALDRVRDKDLDSSFLRTEASKKLILVAYQLLNYKL